MSISNCNVHNEHSKLKSVVVGISGSWGPTPTVEQAIDPKSKEHILAGTYPTESDVHNELEGLVSVLEAEGVEVFNPAEMFINHAPEELLMDDGKDLNHYAKDKLNIVGDIQLERILHVLE